jgi:hypothetical protein
MAYYTALITEWAVITAANPTHTTAQKLADLAAVTVTGSVPTLFNESGQAIFSCINYTEYAALTAAQQATIMAICQMANVTSGSASNLGAGGFFTSIFTNLSGPTITALIALAQATPQPWWQANGYPAPINANDLVAAGNLT